MIFDCNYISKVKSKLKPEFPVPVHHDITPTLNLSKLTRIAIANLEYDSKSVTQALCR